MSFKKPGYALVTKPSRLPITESFEIDQDGRKVQGVRVVFESGEVYDGPDDDVVIEPARLETVLEEPAPAPIEAATAPPAPTRPETPPEPVPPAEQAYTLAGTVPGD